MKHKTWAEMTDIEKGELMLAHHNGRTIEFLAEISGNWLEVTAPLWNASSIYRVKPEPKREKEFMYYGRVKSNGTCPPYSHLIAFDLIDGEPDCASIKMVRIGATNT